MSGPVSSGENRASDQRLCARRPDHRPGQRIFNGRNAGVNLLYDNAAAGEQWQKLQQAQEIVIAKVQPLRVNLPVRGQHFTFTQVLQTEGGQPMTIRLFAASTKDVSWPVRGLTGVGAFLILWTMVTLLSRLTLRTNRD